MNTIAVVILNWNGLGFLKQFIPAVAGSCGILERQLPGWKAVTVVADNGSDDGSSEWLEEMSAKGIVKAIFLDKNHGFTGGYNRALDSLRAEGCYDYYVLLNSDIEVTQEWLVPLASWMQEHPDTGIVCPKLRSWHDREIFEYAGAAGGFIDRFGYPFCRGRVMSSVEKDNGQYDFPREIFWATGAALMIRSQLYHECGGLDESFFAHMEEIDLCWRVHLRGIRIWNIPESVVYHIGGGALPNNSPRKLYLNYRNNLLMLYKNLPEKGKKSKILFRMILDGVASAIYIMKGQLSYARAVFDAHKDFRKMRTSANISPRFTEDPIPGWWNGTILSPFKGSLRIFLNIRNN